MYLNVSLHDITPRFEAEAGYLLEQIRQSGVLKGSILVVPNFHGLALLRPESAFVNRIKELAGSGWEIVLHGLTHKEPVLHHDRREGHPVIQYFVSRWYTNGEGEFYRLSGTAARARIYKGLSILAACGLKPAGFIAPAWLLNKESVAALNEFNFTFTTTLGGITDLCSGAFYPAPAITFSSRSFLRAILSRLFVPFLAGYWERQELVRLVLHPLDARSPAIMEIIKKLCRRMLAFRRLVTIREYLDNIKGPHAASSVIRG